MKIVLLFPPPGNLSQPYTSLPALTAFLRREGHTVVQRDLGIEVIEALLTPAHLEEVGAQVARRLTQLGAEPQPTPRETAEREALQPAVVSAEYVARHVDAAKRALRSPEEFFDFDRFRWAARLIGHALRLLSAAHWPSSFSFNHGFTNYSMPRYGWSATELLAATADARHNVFLHYFEDDVVPAVLAEAPQLVGLSATYPGQLIPSLTLARLLKAARPDLHVCLGGAVLAEMKDELLRSPLIFDVVDSLVVCEGEHALSGLARALAGDGDLSAVPNLLYRDGQQVRFTSVHVEDVNALPTPDYAGLPLDLYLTPEITALLPTERGCYWGRCSFCTISTGMRHAYRPRKIELVVEDMKSLNRQLGTRCFFFATDAISPARMKALARLVAAEGLDFHWQTEARLEKALTPETCQTLVQGGCRHLRMGLESGSQPVLDAMHKGLKVDAVARAVHTCHAAGISVHTCLILGFPSETRDQARETLRFIEANRDAISSLTYALFGLYKGSPVYNDPARYGVTHMQFPPDDWLNGHVAAYEVDRGMSPEEARGPAYAEGAGALSQVLPFVLPLNMCLMAVAHPLHFFTHWAYLPYLVHYGVTHYRDLPLDVNPPWPAGAAQALDVSPRLSQNVVIDTGHGHTLTLFDPHQGTLAAVEPAAGSLLARCDGRSTVRQIAEQFAAGSGADFAKDYLHGLQLCARLLREGFLQVNEGEVVAT